ncbi:hypothetical protein L7F22_062408 [Adiantum nelumboides]|nr:hypothetical protein [Adiantum nelumboides]
MIEKEDVPLADCDDGKGAEDDEEVKRELPIWAMALPKEVVEEHLLSRLHVRDLFRMCTVHSSFSNSFSNIIPGLLPHLKTTQRPAGGLKLQKVEKSKKAEQPTTQSQPEVVSTSQELGLIEVVKEKELEVVELAAQMELPKDTDMTTQEEIQEKEGLDIVIDATIKLVEEAEFVVVEAKIADVIEAEGCRPGTPASPYEEASDDDDNGEHASEGEGVERGDDDALEADGSVLDDSPEADCEFVDVVPLEWRSGDKMEQEPPGTFWPLPTFNGLVGLDLGHVPHEFSEFHLFLMLFPLDLIDHIINETNMYANLQRGRCSSLHESMRRWVPLDRHSFLRFLGMALGMALNYMPSKKHYWKDDIIGSLHFPNFGDKMSHTSFQQIKRYISSQLIGSPDLECQTCCSSYKDHYNRYIFKSTRSTKKSSSDDERIDTNIERILKGSDDESPKGSQARGSLEFEKGDEDITSTPLKRKETKKSKVPKSTMQIDYPEAQAKVEERKRMLATTRVAKVATSIRLAPHTMEQARQARIEAAKKLQAESQRIAVEQKA